MTDKYIPASKLLALTRYAQVFGVNVGSNSAMYKPNDDGDWIDYHDLRALIDEAPEVEKQEIGGKAVIKIHPEGWEYGEEPAGEPYTGGHVAVLALKNTELSKRISVLEDLLSSAYNIASRNGVETHWFRFSSQLHINGISPVTAKTFKILPSDPEHTSPQPDIIAELVKALEDDAHAATFQSMAQYRKWLLDLAKGVGK